MRVRPLGDCVSIVTGPSFEGLFITRLLLSIFENFMLSYFSPTLERHYKTQEK